MLNNKIKTYFFIHSNLFKLNNSKLLIQRDVPYERFSLAPLLKLTNEKIYSGIDQNTERISGTNEPTNLMRKQKKSGTQLLQAVSGPLKRNIEMY
jgi:hypothetical protein